MKQIFKTSNDKILEFLKFPAAPGILLGLSALISLIVVNSPLSSAYDVFLKIPVSVQFANFYIDKPLLLWINDGLMAIFFLLVGLEVKREILTGHLSSRDSLMLPLFAALGGLAMPALIYVFFNHNSPETLQGWAIPAATDIAFAYGVMMLLGNRVPAALKVTLVAIAIIDDIAAVIIIALFYTSDLSYISLVIAFCAICVLITLNACGIRKIGPYIIVGLVLWASVLKSGVHATLAGVILGLCIPHLGAKGDEKKHRKDLNKPENSPLVTTEHALHGWVSFGVLPIFAFANAGVSFEGLSMETFATPITLGILFGLLFGKQMGVMILSFIAVQLKLCKLPKGICWKQFYAMSILTGIGFTMSFFIGTLAFTSEEHLQSVRLGVLSASAIAAVSGYMLLRYLSNRKHRIAPQQ